MPASPRKERERHARHRAILATARELAETEGWQAVTTRRLSEEIEYSQPVLYSHFRNRQAIVTAVAEEGFAELVHAVRHATADAATTPAARLHAAGTAYLNYAATHPAVYQAMFELATDMTFADSETPPSATAGFDALRDSVVAAISTDDPDTLTEIFWSSLHGLASLHAAQRLRDEYQAQRLRLLVDHLTMTSPYSRRTSASS
ncbi:MAG: TetR/AcrR family transcriptional regulator [Microbacterium sp.]